MTRRVIGNIFAVLFITNQLFAVAGENNCIPEDFRFYHLGTGDGLSQSRAYRIFEDKKGYMWFGTQSGLNRWDGYNFKKFFRSPGDSTSISHNHILEIFEDSYENLWVGTTEGLNLYIKEKESFLRVPLSENIRNDRVFMIAEDNSGNLWITSNQGLYRIRSTKQKQISSASPPPEIEKVKDEIFQWLQPLESSKLVLGDAGKDIMVYDISSGNSKYIPFPKDFDASPSLLQSHRILTDSRGRIWVAVFNEGIYQFLVEEERIIKLDINVPLLVNDILEYCDGVFMFTTDSDGLFIYNEKTGEIKNIKSDKTNPASLSSDKLLSLFKGSTGQLWISSSIASINVFSPARNKFQTFGSGPVPNQSLSHESVLSFHEDEEGIIWIGTELGGLNRFNPKTNRFDYFMPDNSSSGTPSDIPILSLFEDNMNRLWIGTWESGLYLFRPKTGNFEHFSFKHLSNNNKEFSIWAIENDSAGNLLLGTHRGLIRYNPENGRSKHYEYEPGNENSLGNNAIFSIVRTQNDKIYIGTAGGGLILFDTERESFVKISETTSSKDPVKSSHVYDIYEDRDNRLLLSMEYGFSIYTPEENRFEFFTDEDGLPNNIIRGIVQDSAGNYWISYVNGLTKFNYATREFRNFSSSDGLQKGEFKPGSVIRTSDNLLYFGGNEGFSVINPDQLIENRVPPKIVFTGLEINGNRVKAGDTINNMVLLEKELNEIDELKIKYEKQIISIEFAALHFTSPENNKYAYKLDGLMENWIYTDAANRMAKFINLKPGSYTFLVKAANSDNYWNNEGISLKLTIIAPWYLSWWAFSFYVLIIAFLLFLARRIFMMNLNYQHSLNIEKLKTTQIEELYNRDKEINTLKMMMFTNVSHEFRTPLTLIIGPLESLIRKIKDSSVKEELIIVRKNAQRLLVLINQMLDIRKLELGKYRISLSSGDIVACVQEIYSSFQLLAAEKKINFNLKIDCEKSELLYDRDIIEKILYNLLSNAFKYTPTEGSITLSLKCVPQKSLSFLVTDTGRGIPEEEKEFIFDRFYRTRQDKFRNTEGSGVGLSLTRDLVQLYGGEILVESAVGKGTSFTVNLPADNSLTEKFELKTDPQPEAKDSGIISKDTIEAIEIDYGTGQDDLISETSIDENKHTMLIVDDNPDMRQYLLKNLQTEYNVILAENGEAGLKKCRIFNPDIIVSDIMMPVLDGIEFCKKIKSDIRYNHIPVILLTAKLTDKDEVYGLESGADDYIHKPFNMEIFLAKVQSILKNRAYLREKYSVDLLTGKIDFAADNADREFLGNAVKAVEKNLNVQSFGVDALAREIGMGRTNFYKKLKSLTGYTVNEFIRMIRLKKAEYLLKNSSKSISEIYFEVGFNDGSYFASCFQKQYSMLPSEYREKHKV